MGVCKIKEFQRRIDIKCYPFHQFAFALLHCTGSDHFNRSMRLFAKKKGLSLTDEGLFQVNRVNKEKVWISQSVICHSEKAIFDYLNLEFKRPEERNV